MMEKLDLSFYLEPPELTVEGTLEITALAPLSMVASQPGTYFRTALKPPVHMIYGMLENALGWHFPLALRKDILKGLATAAKKKHRKNPAYKGHPWLTGKPTTAALTNYFSLLQYHLEVEEADDPEMAMTYDDLWSMHLKDQGAPGYGGSRIYDYRLEKLVTALRQSKSKGDKRIITGEGEKKGFKQKKLEEIYHLQEGKIHLKSIQQGYPQYYVSPKKRGFVVPNNAYRMPFRATEATYKLLVAALTKSIAPTYLGTNEGWVDANLIDGNE